MVTTIQVSERLITLLKERKFSDSETYEDVILDMIEDSQELSEETKRHIAKSELDIKLGRIYTHEQVKKKLGL
ncbi:hypothetical protein HY483_01925 [Candidatus Woesearchaeota archaeon]|nr:hypothetical protein [Candidatus Woesearchaeota archaeon]